MTDPQVILITGASSGIGETTARYFAKRGFKVAMAARRIERLEEIAKEIQAGGGEAIAVQADVSDNEVIQGMVRQTLERFGKIDVLFNNAGFGKFNWLENLDPVKDIEGQMQVNALGTILTSRAVLPHMIERRSGHIINMCSMAGMVATPTYTIYAASKFAVRGFSQALRREVSVWGIHVSVILPGGASTEFGEKAGATKRKTGVTTPKFLKLTTEQIAAKVYQVVQRPQRMVVFPGLWRVSIWLDTLFQGFADKVIEKRFVIPERGLDGK